MRTLLFVFPSAFILASQIGSTLVNTFDAESIGGGQGPSLLSVQGEPCGRAHPSGLTSDPGFAIRELAQAFPPLAPRDTRRLLVSPVVDDVSCTGSSPIGATDEWGSLVDLHIGDPVGGPPGGGPTLRIQGPYSPRVDLDGGRYLKALWEAEARLRQEPGLALAWAAKSQALAALARLDEAMVAAEKALALSPALPDALLARGLAQAGRAIQQKNLGSVGLIRGALEDLRAAVKADPTLQAGWMALGIGLQKLPGLLGGSTRKALAAADSLRRINRPLGDLLAGTVLVDAGRWHEAEGFLGQAIAVGAKDPQVIYGYLEVLGSREAHQRLGEEGQNIRLATEARRLLPNARGRSRALQGVADALLDADLPEEAWTVAMEGLASSEAPSLLRVTLGKIAARAGIHREEGLAHLDAALKEALEGGIGGYQTVHWRRAQILKDLGRKEQALSAAREALKLDPGHRGAKRVVEEM